MPPKKDDKKKGGGAPAPTGATQTITEDELNGAKELPMLDDYVFTNLFAFKMTRNKTRLVKQIQKQFQYINPEDPAYTEELAAKYRTIDMNQLLAQAQSRGLLTEAEVADMSTVDPAKRRQVFAQSTVESVTAFQLALRRKKKEVQDAQAQEAQAQAAAGVLTPQSNVIGEGEEKEDENPKTPEQEKTYKFEQLLYLQDFPQTFDDVQELVKLGFQQLNGVYLVEEVFNRDQEDEEDDDTGLNQAGISEAALEEVKSVAESTQAAPKVPEKLTNKLQERVTVFENIVAINRFLKDQPQSSALRQTIVERLKFEGPQDPMEIPPIPEDGSEPPVIDEDRKAKEFKFYDEFALYLRDKLEATATELQQFRDEYSEAQKNMQQLWPAPIDPEVEARRKAKAELRASQEALRIKEEQERMAAEADAKGKGGKKSQQKEKRAGTVQSSLPEGAEEVVDAIQAQATSRTEEEQFKSQDDDPSKTWDFHQFKKIMNEIKPGNASVGSILGAMVFQIDQNNQKIHKEAMDEKYYESGRTKAMKKLSSRLLKLQSSKQIQVAAAQEAEMTACFDEAIASLAIEHSVVETDYKHEFKTDPTLDNPLQMNSPYMVVKSENDKIITDKNAYHFLDGNAQDNLEKRTLENSLLPGVNKRLGMPEKATLKQALRESDQDQIIQFCRLPAPQTRRCLILKAFEDMMQNSLKERTFSFLDRNYVERYNDKEVMRQVLSSALNQWRPEIISEYFPMDDGLLVSIFFKNPPGRLLRRQWTSPVRVMPDFQSWKKYVKEDGVPIMSDRLLDISKDKTGVLRSNTKFCFPSDNSMIRVDRYNVGQRRFGESQILKDNFMFGIIERKNVFDQKVDGEDSLRNRDAKSKQDKRCDFWLQFENGVRLNIEMQDHCEAQMENVPPSQIPQWLQTKIEKEQKKLRDMEEMGSEGAHNKSMDDLEKIEGQAVDVVSMNRSMQESAMLSKDGDPKSDNDPNGGTGTRLTLNSKIDKSEKKPSQAVLNEAQDEKPEGEENAEEKPVQIEEESEVAEEEDPELLNPNLFVDGVDMTQGAKLSFTFKEGLVVQIQPNGDCLQKCIVNTPMPKSQTKNNQLIMDQVSDAQTEVQRIITTNGEIIKYLADGNFIIYYSDGTLTSSDKRRGIWHTINPQGVKRVRRVKDRIVTDEMTKLNIETKVDPETNATLKIREDGVLSIEYVDQSHLIIMPDGTNILKKKRANGEAGTVTLITKDGFVPIRQIYDPVKARAKTVIGLGGTDALMGKDQIMERTNTGKISEVLLPDKTVVQSYLEKQELEGYNRFSTSMIHIIRRDDFSVVKVRQDGEVVLITANERAYLNEIGKNIEDFGSKDYDYFFELFGIPNERRSGVYTANLDHGRVWTEDEEGNYFIVYANGDSVEKMSVSFNLDQMVEGIENKEPSSPRIRDGEYIEDECKFLPPPKSMGHPRLFYIKNDGSGMEYFNEEQLRHMFRTNRKSSEITKKSIQIKIDNENCVSHTFTTKVQEFNAQGFDISAEFPKLPQNLELVNQTVSIPTEPVTERFQYKNVLEFNSMDNGAQDEFHNALAKYEAFRENERKTEEDLQITEPSISTTASLPQSDTRMRSSVGLNSTMISQNSPKSGNSSIRGAGGSPRNRSFQRNATKMKVEDGALETENAAAAAIDEELLDDIEIDENTGLQMYKNELENQLSFMQRLQLRIAAERNISVQSLKGDEFAVLKDYKKLEERKKLLNTADDFFDSQYDAPQEFDQHRGNIRVSGLDNESRQQLLSDHGEHAFYTQESQSQQNKNSKKGFNLLTVNP